jgi:RNA-directed DNA polymerase
MAAGEAPQGRRIVRYADDFAIMVCGSKAHADALWEEVADVLAPLGLRLSESKTRVVHLDEGFDFLGFRIQRRTKRGTGKKTVYTYPKTCFQSWRRCGRSPADHDT